jgi:integrase
MKKARKIAISGDQEPEQSGGGECGGGAQKRVATRLRLTGHIARRNNLAIGTTWDTELPGFGLRHRKTGARSWIVRYRIRGQAKLVTLGPTAELSVGVARAKARRLLVEASLAGLPQRPKQKRVPTFAEFVPEFLRDYGPHWKPSTLHSNVGYIERELIANFGKLPIDQIGRAHVARWRDSLRERSGAFNRAVPVFAVMLRYAEQLGHRPKGTNPCKGIARYKRQLPERFLSADEYRRLGRTLATIDFPNPNLRHAIMLLIYSGARCGEIANLKWREVQPPRLMLEDSKTGPKTIYLNTQAKAVLEELDRGADSALVFPALDGCSPQDLSYRWDRVRRHAALPDVRLHDLRHSFASTAIVHGVPFATIGKLLGHALPETTARYTHLADALISETAERLCTGLAQAFGLNHDQP